MITFQSSALWGSWSDPASSPNALLALGGSLVAGQSGSSALESVSSSGGILGSSGSVGGFLYSSQISLTPFTIGGSTYVISTGHYFQDALAYRVSGSALSAPMRILSDGGLVTGIAHGTHGGDHLYTISRIDGQITTWAGGMGGWHATQHLAVPGATKGGALTALELVGDFVYVANAQTNTIESFHIGESGQLAHSSAVNATNGLMLTSPSALTSAMVDGTQYLILAANSSASVAVLRLGPSGSMQVTDQITDSMLTRFKGANILHSFSAEGKSYIAAAGGDKGLSIFTLLPNGQLAHCVSLEDTTDITLDAVSSIQSQVSGGQVTLFVTSTTEAGATRLVFHASGGTVSAVDGHIAGGGAADQLSGGNGNDVIAGGGGNDILYDGAGADKLNGGPGADLFVLAKDGADDVIEDFNITQDRLDLSRLENVHGRADLTFAHLSGGVEIRAGDEVLKIKSHDGHTLAAWQFTDAMLFDLDHVDISNTPIVAPNGIWEPPSAGNALSANATSVDLRLLPGDLIMGGAGAQVLEGSAKDEIIFSGEISAEDAYLAPIVRLYQGSLGRVPDWGGITYWAGVMKSGQPLKNIAGWFTNSAEFQSRFGAPDPEPFVQLMYRNVLDRPLDGAGYEYWVSSMRDHGRSAADVLVGFSESEEFKAKMFARTLSYGFEALTEQYQGHAFRLFRATFARDPDPVGFEFWAGEFAKGRSPIDIASGFANSEEFRLSYGAVDNTRFIELMYNNVLGRDPDAQGYAYWRKAMEQNGQSRAEVLHGFAQSAEFQNNTAEALRAWHRTQSDDVITPGGGRNHVFGGPMSDRFEFDAGTAGHTTIMDFELWDYLVLRGFGYADAAEARSHMVQNGDDVVFEDAQVRIVLEDTTLSYLDDATFVLA